MGRWGNGSNGRLFGVFGVGECREKHIPFCDRIPECLDSPCLWVVDGPAVLKITLAGPHRGRIHICMFPVLHCTVQDKIITAKDQMGRRDNELTGQKILSV